MSSSRHDFRIGSVPYLNAKPLHHPLGSDVVFYPPLELAERLHAGELDAALVPIAECLLHPEYLLVDNVGIGCMGPVYSVILTGKTALEKTRTVALDAESKTSVLLCRVLLERYHDLPITYVPQNQPADRHLWIGDQAIRHRTQNPDELPLDLGQEWQSLTGLPFVFAVWAIRRGVDAPALADHLRQAKTTGLSARRQIAATEQEYRYLTESIRYDVGPAEKDGVLRFAQDLVGLKVLAEVPELHWI